MADVRPTPGIRYAPGTDLAAVISPPYDVISPDAQARYYERSPSNIIRIELGRDEPSDDALNNRYTRAAMTFAEWRLQGIMRQDAPSLYVYEQRFASGGRSYQRTALMARVGLEPWSEGIILPHEQTLSKPKSDRLQLLRACAANTSPIMALYDDPQGELGQQLAAIRSQPALAAATDEAGEQHTLWATAEDPRLFEAVAMFFASRQLYIADGHHRYETALAYQDEARAARKESSPYDATNYTLMALMALEDPGLVLLPTHRVLRGIADAALDGLDARLDAYFEMEALSGGEAGAWMQALDAAKQREPQRIAFVIARPGAPAVLARIRPAGVEALAHSTGPDVGTSEAWRALDVAAAHVIVLRELLGLDEEAVRAGGNVRYTHDASEAAGLVKSGSDGAQIAMLLSATPAAAMRDVARAGERMPQKSTYFYPKLITGLVINPLW